MFSTKKLSFQKEGVHATPAVALPAKAVRLGISRRVAVIASIMLLGGGGLFAIFGGFSQVKPYQVLAKMMHALENVDSMEVTTSFVMDVDLQPTFDQIRKEYNAEQVSREAEGTELLPSFDEMMQVYTGGLGPQLQFRYTAREYGNTKKGADARVAGEAMFASPFVTTSLQYALMGEDNLYLQIPEFTVIKATSPMLEEITDDFVEVEELYNSILGDTWLYFNLEQLLSDEYFDDEESATFIEEYEALQKEITAAFVEMKPVVFIEPEGKKYWSHYVYNVTPHPYRFKKFLVRVAEIVTEQKLSEEDIAELEYGYDFLAGNMDTVDMQIAISKRTNLPAWIQVSGVIEEMELEEFYIAAIPWELRIDFGKYNETFDIEAPEDAVPFETFIEEIMSGERGTLLESAIEARDYKRLSDMKQLQTALELHHIDMKAYPVENKPVVLGTNKISCLNKDGFGISGCTNPYMGILPSDPLSEESYVYTSVNGRTYTIEATLEGDVGSLSAGAIIASPSGIVNK